MDVNINKFMTTHYPFFHNHILANLNEANDIIGKLRFSETKTDPFLLINDETTKRSDLNNSEASRKYLRLKLRKLALDVPSKEPDLVNKCILFAYWTDVHKCSQIAELFPKDTTYGIIVLLPETFKLLDTVPVEYSEYKTAPLALLLLNKMIKDLGLDAEDMNAMLYYRLPLNKYNKQVMKIKRTGTIPAEVKIAIPWMVRTMLDSMECMLTAYLKNSVLTDLPLGFDRNIHILNIRTVLTAKDFDKAVREYKRNDLSQYSTDVSSHISMTTGPYNQNDIADAIILWRGWESTILAILTPAQIDVLRKHLVPKIAKRHIIESGFANTTDLHIHVSILIGA